MTRTVTDGRRAIQLRALKGWAVAKLGRIEHERRVARVAGALLSATSPLHAFSSRDRRLLRMACFVHDVGRSKTRKGHADVGAAMILNAGFLPVRNRERRALAYLTLYHRGPVPTVGNDPILKKSDDAAGLRLVLAFLRAADGLDCRSLESPRLQFSLIGRRLRIACVLDSDCPKSVRVFSRRKKFRLLEEALGCRVEVDVRVPEREAAA